MTVGRLLVVHHTTSPATQALFEAVLAGARDPDAGGPDVVARPALVATALDVLQADAIVLGTPVNIGYMSGALKHFFDLVYYPCLDATVGRPYALYVHGNDDLTGAVRSVESIARGLRWRRVAEPVRVVGAPDAVAATTCRDLGALLAAYAAGLA